MKMDLIISCSACGTYLGKLYTDENSDEIDFKYKSKKDSLEREHNGECHKNK